MKVNARRDEEPDEMLENASAARTENYDEQTAGNFGLPCGDVQVYVQPATSVIITTTVSIVKARSSPVTTTSVMSSRITTTPTARTPPISFSRELIGEQNVPRFYDHAGIKIANK